MSDSNSEGMKEFLPAFVGRRDELELLKQCIDDVLAKRGRCVVISGEAGIGKTRLVEELISFASKKGFKCLKGSCLTEELTPFMPFVDALRQAELDYLFVETQPPRVECVYLVNNFGILLSKVERKDSKLEPDIFASMLTAVNNFVKDSLEMLDGVATKKGLSRIDYNGWSILIESEGVVNLVVILSGRENEFLKADMRRTILEISQKYGSIIKNWDGNLESVAGTADYLDYLISSGKYDGIDYIKDNPKGKRNRLFENISQGLTLLTDTTPLLIFIDDLHWADSSTLALIHYLARNTRHLRVIIIGTYRPEEIAQYKQHPLENTLHLMGREGLVRKINLSRLSSNDMNNLIESMFKPVDLTDKFREVIYRETEGNPLFAIELLKLFVETNILVKVGGVWQIDKRIDLHAINVPTKIHDVIVRRLNRLQNSARHILECASVVGLEFRSTTIERILGLKRHELLQNLQVLEKVHHLIRYTKDRYVFDHTKIREVLLTELSDELKKEYHLETAKILEHDFKDKIEKVCADIGHHYFEVGDKRGIKYLITAAESAKNTYANSEALHLYSNARTLIEQHVADEKELAHTLYDVLINTGDLYSLTGNWNYALNNYETALDIAKKIYKARDLNLRTANLLCKMGMVHEKRGLYEIGMKIYNEGINVLGDEKCIEAGHLYGGLGTIYMRTAKYDKAISCQKAFEQICKIINNDKELAHAYNNLGNIYYSLGDWDEAIRYYEKSLRIFEDLEDCLKTASCYNNIGAIYANKGDWNNAIIYYQKSLKLKEKIGDIHGIATVYNNLGAVYSHMGYLNMALDYHIKSLRIKESIGDMYGIATSYNNVGIVFREMGNLQNALRYYEKSLAMREQLNDTHGMIMVYNNIGEIYNKLGNREKAFEYWSKSIAVREKVDGTYFEGVAESCIGLGEVYVIEVIY